MHRGQLWWVLAALYACGAVAESTTLAECRQIADADRRVACYDIVVDQLLVDNAPTSTFGENQPVERAPIEPAEPPVESIDAVIAQVHEDARGKWVLELDNNQTWVQTDSRRLTLAAGDRVVIHKARFGSYLLEKAAGSRGIAVKRTDSGD